MAYKYDLSLTIAKYLDRHLVFPLLEFVQQRGLYEEKEVLKGKIELLQKTNMVDFAADIYKNLYGTEDIPPAMAARRGEVVEKLKKLQTDARPILEFFLNPAKVGQLKQDKAQNLKHLQEEHGLTVEQIDALYLFAKFQFDCGNYSVAGEFLQGYRTLCTDTEKNLSSLWGKLAAEILMQRWDAAFEELSKLRDVLENAGSTEPAMLLQQRCWLLHWGLFVFWNHKEGKTALVDLFLSEKYQVALQINAQHLLRYLSAAVIINKRRRNVMQSLIKLIQQEAYEYSDPMTEFLVCVFVKYDFDGAQEKLKECEVLMANDFFLAARKDEFVENARLCVFETYCRIHSCIDIRMLASKLNMETDAAEKWIANLIRNSRLDAKIDSTAGTVVMGQQYPSLHDAVLERTKALSVKTFHLANTVVGAR